MNMSADTADTADTAPTPTASDIVLVAETGSDVPFDLAKRYGVHLVPMHVSFDGATYDDGAFPVEDVCDYYRRSGQIPKTSGCSPADFTKVFDEIHERFPNKQILHLAYSAVTTCSYESARIAAEGRDYVTSVDTKQVSGGQGIIVMKMAELLKTRPDMLLSEAIKAAKDFTNRARMAFLPDDLAYLRAGGRVSNAAFLGSRLLHIHPCIELLDGRLLATKKYRGSMRKLVARLISDFAQTYRLDRDVIWLIRAFDLPKSIIDSAQHMAQECGFKNILWVQGGCVITTHAGPGAFGIASFAETSA
jgi:DegV family protein with EDD domain